MTAQSHLRRCFWKKVTIEPYQEATQLFYRPLLDGRVIRLPKGHILQLSSYLLAEKIAAEWAGIQEGAFFKAEDFSLSRIAGTMIERIEPEKEEIYQILCSYGQDDAFCYQSPAHNAEIREKISHWLKKSSLCPSVTKALMPIRQDEHYLASLRKILAEKNSFALASLGVLAPLFSSLLIALALLDNILTEEEAFQFGFADEYHQLKIWGDDAELIKLLELRKKDMQDALIFYRLSLLDK